MVRWTRLQTKTKPEENERQTRKYLAKIAELAKKKRIYYLYHPLRSLRSLREKCLPAVPLTQSVNQPVGNEAFGPEDGFERVGAGDEADVAAPFGDQWGQHRIGLKGMMRDGFGGQKGIVA